MDVHEYRKKWGTRGLSIMVEAFIAEAPPFPREAGMAKMIGEAIADLEMALNDAPVDYTRCSMCGTRWENGEDCQLCVAVMDMQEYELGGEA